MASKIRVNTGTLNQTRQTVQSRLSQIKKGMQQIEADMAALNAMWTGDAHNTKGKSSFDFAFQYEYKLRKYGLSIL